MIIHRGWPVMDAGTIGFCERDGERVTRLAGLISCLFQRLFTPSTCYRCDGYFVLLPSFCHTLHTHTHRRFDVMFTWCIDSQSPEAL